MHLDARTLSTGLLAGVLMAGGVSIAAAGDARLPKLMTWTAYTVGTAGYGQAVAIGNMLKSELGVTVRVLPGRNDVSRLKPLVAKRAQLCSCGASLYMAQEGIKLFSGKAWGPQPARMVMMSLSPVGMMMATQKDRGVTTLADLKGKRVGYISGGPTQNTITEANLAFAGLSWADVERVDFSSYVASIKGLVNGQVDAIIAFSASPAMRQVAAAPDGLVWLTVPHDDEAGWRRYLAVAPYFIKMKVRVGAAIPKGEPIDGAMYPYPILISIGGLSDAHGYALTKAMVKNYDLYKDSAPGAKGWSIRAQKFRWVIPYGDGAIRYFKEIGRWTAEDQRHNDALVRRQARLSQAWKDFKAANDGLSDAEFAEKWLAARAAALKAADLPLHVAH